MFGNNKKEESKSKGGVSSASPSTHSLNSLVKGTVVDGSVKAESDIRVDGTIKGKLNCEAKVIIGPTGFVEGEIKCKNAVVEGRFEGVMIVEELLNVRESAQVKGDVTTGKLIVQPGGVFNVTCNMGGLNQKMNINHKGFQQEGTKDAKGKEAKPAGV
ncbi:MAG: hypothetical protein DHS20C18_13600 [Saprospiraceae bacterium]|nr:MAG: hypothetical protein DHS20C18_13600 [Saprospiraceae bacterium]